MPVSLKQFVKQLEDSGLLPAGTLKEYLPPKASPSDADALAHELVRVRMLTPFQADELLRGRGKSLTLGNYVILEKIGAGAMGQVYKARHRRMDRIVAVKVLAPTLTKTTPPSRASNGKPRRLPGSATPISSRRLTLTGPAACTSWRWSTSRGVTWRQP